MGASGAIYGIIAMWCVDLFQNLKGMKKPCITATIVVFIVLASFALGLLPYIDNFAHIGGFIFGLELSIVLLPKFNWDRVWKRRLRYILMFFFSALFLVNFIGFFFILYTVDLATFCPNCRYISCIPWIRDGVDWCSI